MFLFYDSHHVFAKNTHFVIDRDLYNTPEILDNRTGLRMNNF
jgi:hypothetical protein